MSLLFCLVLVAVFLGCDASALALRPRAFEASDLLTSLLAHQDEAHLVKNLLCLVPAAALFERRHGSLALVSFSAAAGVVGNLCELWASPIFPGAILGASGIACGLFGAFALASRTSLVVSLGLLGYLIHGAMVQPEGHIAYFAHLGGYLCGVLWAILEAKGAFRWLHDDTDSPHPTLAPNTSMRSSRKIS